MAKKIYVKKNLLLRDDPKYQQDQWEFVKAGSVGTVDQYNNFCFKDSDIGNKKTQSTVFADFNFEFQKDDYEIRNE